MMFLFFRAVSSLVMINASRGKLLLCVSMVLYMAGALASPQRFDQYSVLSALTLNFARFTQWPEQAFSGQSQPLQVCLVGDNVVQQAFEAIHDKNIADRSIEVVNTNRLRNLHECHIIFISELPKNILMQVFLSVKSLPILTIGQSEEFVESGGMVGMINVDGKIKLYINLPVVRASGLMISSNLLRLSRIFDESIKKGRE